MRTFTSLFIITISLTFPYLVKADPWDNLTYEEAEKVQGFLQSFPYLLDYCDCCDFEGDYAAEVFLVKVISSEIVSCSWDENYYSVQTEVEVIAKIPYESDGPRVDRPISMTNEDQLTIFMNYTWGYNSSERKATPLFCIIPYETYGEEDTTSGVCREFVNFPDPKDGVTDKDYKSWYHSVFE